MASLFAALTTAVSGLSAQSSAIGNISDNLANAQTTGYKSVGTNFEELVNSSSATINNPGGVFATPQYQNDVQGSIQSSNTSTNIAISGSGYYSVTTATTDAAGNTNFTGNNVYTRAGDFTLNKNGYLVNSAGYYLNGYTVQNPDGSFKTSSINAIQVSALLNNPVPTSTATYVANLPANAATNYTSSTATVSINDAFGNPHDLNYTWTKTGTNTWSLAVNIPAGNGASDYNAVIPFTFSNGASTTAGTISAIAQTGSGGGSGTGTGLYTATTPETTGNPATVTLNLSFPGTTANSQPLTLNFGTYGGSTGITQFADTQGTVQTTNFDQNGLPRGSFNSLSISNDGLVSLNYSNGTTKTIAQIPIVQFYAQDQLQRLTGGAYEATLDAGSPRYSSAGQLGAGTISAGSLEASNVDIATQFTTLIQAQQVYSANAKVITADNSLLQTTINMVQ